MEIDRNKNQYYDIDILLNRKSEFADKNLF